ncbi:molecular chaperone DnaJ [Sulfuriferula nivalis]|uniref:Molecular chaperone DnaJ n=1 Tax=Sulfuriferula nivalis TaxID=2675298 RepID=A0A809SCQ9_9PROT|nr:molecular chaperone DnaJ [Sulfuriferula nivalis]BBP00057.1 molecular chaperone DnaJ [Sulfuriferula nivalis]
MLIHCDVMTKSQPIQISTAPEQGVLSPAQKKFNATLKKIEAQKALLAEWQAELQACQQASHIKLEPLRRSLYEQQAIMLLLLDNLYKTEKFARNQQEKIANLIMEMCNELITEAGRADLKSLYNQYSETDYDAEVIADKLLEAELLQDMFEAQFGVTLDDSDELDFADPDMVAARLHEKHASMQRDAQVQRNARKKSAKQLTQEAREQEEAAGMSKSIQAVYRQLVTALHPDRETDPVERERKTELMQQVNVAYTKKDLLQLLSLQLSVEQISQDNINNIAEDRLKHYNKVLANQLNELQQEVRTLEIQVKQMVGVSPYEPLSPKKLVLILKQDMQGLQYEIARIKQDIRAFKNVKHFKDWLKGYQIS